MRINEENRSRNGHVLIWDQPGLNSDDKKPKSKTPLVIHIHFNFNNCRMTFKTRVHFK